MRLRRAGPRRLPLRVRWTRRRAAGLAGGIGLTVLVLLGVVNVIGRAAPEVSACEAAAPALPDLEAVPFAFDPEAQARMFVQAMAENDFQTAYEMLALEAWPADSLCEFGLEAFWRTVIGDDSSLLVAVDHSDVLAFSPLYDHLVVSLRLTLGLRPVVGVSQREMYVDVNLLPDGRVIQVRINHSRTSLGSRREVPPPPYVDLNAFEEYETTLGQVPWSLGATLTMPHGPGPFPAVVIVTDRGTSDQDGTVGRSRPYRDLAWGLGMRGIATLRYDQRAVAHALAAARQPDFTLAEEYVNDALAAVNALRKTPRIDPAHVYVLGHGSGGFVAPRIAQQDPEIAGLIVISAHAGTLQDAVWRTHEHLAELDDVVTQAETRWIAHFKTRASTIAALAAGEPMPDDQSLRLSYLPDLAGYQPQVEAYFVRIPLLIMFGGRDGVLPIEDSRLWIFGLSSRPTVAFRYYLDYEHSLLDVGTSSESVIRQHTFHVGKDVITDIASWIAGKWPAHLCSKPEDFYAGCHGG